MGKYSGVIDSLPRMLGSEPKYQQKVQAVKDAIAADPDFKLHATWLAKEYAGLRDEKEQAEAVVKDVNLRLEAVSQLLFDQFEVEGVSSLVVDGRSVAARLVPYASIEDHEAFRQWCLTDADLARKMALPWATTNKIASDLLLAGEELPPGVTIFAKQRFTLGDER
jgi:hypothetical protein